jgi:hypothetical protein
MVGVQEGLFLGTVLVCLRVLLLPAFSVSFVIVSLSLLEEGCGDERCTRSKVRLQNLSLFVYSKYIVH